MLKTIVKFKIMKGTLMGIAKEKVQKLISEEKGLTTVEWILLATFVALCALGVGLALAPVIRGMVGKITNELNTANNQSF